MRLFAGSSKTALALLAPIPAILLGAIIAAHHHIRPAAFAPNAIATLLGIAMFVLLQRYQDVLAGKAKAISAAALVLLASTLFFPGLEGVHRWISLGPLRLHISTVVAPWLIWGTSVLLRRGLATPIAISCAAAAIHVFQPDAGQATSIGVALVILFLRAPRISAASRCLGIAIACGGVFLAWLRADPLQPLDHVERIVHLGLAAPPPVSIATLLVLALLVSPLAIPALRMTLKSQPSSPVAVALAAYFILSIAVTEAGHFPVPIMGAGAGPVIGWYGAMAALALARNHTDAPGAQQVG